MSDEAASGFEIDLEILREFLAEAGDGLASLEVRFVELETNPRGRENLDAIFRIIHSIKGSSGFFNLSALQKIAHRMETVLDWLRKEDGSVTPEIVTSLLQGTDHLKSIIEGLKTEPKPVPMTVEQAAYLEALEAAFKTAQSGSNPLHRILSRMNDLFLAGARDEGLQKQEVFVGLMALHAELHAAAGGGSPAAQAAPTVEGPGAAREAAPRETQFAAGAGAKKTMRVDEDTIDGFMSYIGDLITASESFNYLYKKLDDQRVNPQLQKELQTAIIAFNALSQGLQDSLMEIRKVPVKNLAAKIPRLVRDLAKTLGKEVKLQTSGEDVKIDKSLLEVLEDPLTHMVRNSLDHGLETPEERLGAGKAREGTLALNAWADKSFFHLEIKDDGRGIDPGKIKKIAVKKGVLSEEKAASLTPKEAIQLIFAPGFSSAEQVTEVSGRGVGMDVVLTNIQKANGTIDVNSAVGAGTSIVIRLPQSVTLSVIPALVVGVAREQFVLPLENVREVANLSAATRKTVQGRNEVVMLRDRVFPLIRVGELLSVPQRSQDDGVLVLVEKKGRIGCLLLERLFGLQQVVVKSLGDEFKTNRMISGGVILGDGRVGLVLDVDGLLAQAGQTETNAGN